MTSRSLYQEAGERLVADHAKDAWVGDWLLRAVRRSSGGITFSADHPSGIGCTARTPEAVAALMVAVDRGLAADAHTAALEAERDALGTALWEARDRLSEHGHTADADAAEAALNTPAADYTAAALRDTETNQ